MKPLNALTTVRMGREKQSELMFWVQLFHSDSVPLVYDTLSSGKTLLHIFHQIDGRPQPQDHSEDLEDTVKSRLDNWHFIVQNVRNYYIEVLQEVITMCPPNAVLISRLPDSVEARREVEHIILLLLCAAVRCERRDQFIRQIVERLDPEVQTGIMDCIKNFTENEACVINVERLQSSTADMVRVVRDVMNRMEEMYLNEIRDLLDHVFALQSKLATMQARLRLHCRGRAFSVGPGGLDKRSVSAISLGDPTRGEWNTSTPKLVRYEDSFVEDISIRRFNDQTSESVLYSNDLEPGKQSDAQRLTEDDGGMSQQGDAATENTDFLDSGFPLDGLDLDCQHIIRALYLDTSDCLPADTDKQRLSIELAETKAKLRRARIEIEDQTDQLNELHDQMAEMRRELGQTKEERARLANAAHAARHWQDEVDALREEAERVQHLESENARLKHRIHEADFYKARCDQLAGDLVLLTDEKFKQTNCSPTEEGHLSMQCAVLKEELNKTRARLTEVEQLYSTGLDELKLLREELGQTRLEQQNKCSYVSLPNPASPDGRTCIVDTSDNDESECKQTSNIKHQFLNKDFQLTANLSVQLSEAVSHKLDTLEKENRRLTQELDLLNWKAHGLAKPAAMLVSRRVMSDQFICSKTQNNSTEDASLLSITCERDELKVALNCMLVESQHLHQTNQRLTESKLENEPDTARESSDLIHQLRLSLRASEEKVTKLEEERDDLTTQVSMLQQKCALQKKQLSSERLFTDGASDGDVDENDDEGEDDGEGEEEEADSGNKTGDSTEDTSPDQFNLGRGRRKTFDLVSANNRYRERKRRGKTVLESELKHLEKQLEHIRRVNDATVKELKERQIKLCQKEEEVNVLKQTIQFSTNERIVENSVNHSKAEQFEKELEKLTTTMNSTEEELRRVRKALHEALTDPSSTETGKALVQRISQLELQLTKVSTVHRSAMKQSESRLKDIEKEHTEVCQLLSSERQMTITLRDQLVAEKIQLQRQMSVISNLHTGLKHCGLPSSKVEQLFNLDSGINHLELLESLLRDYANERLESERDGAERMRQRQVNVCAPESIELQSHTDSLTCNQSLVNGLNDRDSKDGQLVDSTHLLVQFKDRAIELERQNALLEQSLQNEIKLFEESKYQLYQMEQTATITHDQLAGVQCQVAELIASNAKLQVENTTLHSQSESLTAQHSRLTNQNAEMEAELTRLRAILESAHTAETHLTTDYFHLQRLHEQLTRDYDLLSQTLKESKETQRHLKNELNTTRTQLDRLQTSSDEVSRLKEALEQERGALKGESKQLVMLREDCARLRGQLDSLTEARDRERVEKAAAVGRSRELRQQMEQLEDRGNRMKVELENRRSTDQKFHIELAELRSRVQTLTELNDKLEKDRKTLMFQLQGLLGQNQELLTSTIETCTSRVAEEGALHERLLSLQRHKQLLEDKLMEQYRNVPQTNNCTTDRLSDEGQRRMNLVQKARAALTKRKELTECPAKCSTLPNPVNRITDVREQTNSMKSQQSLSNDTTASATNLSMESPGYPKSAVRLVPGSVSIYDRDPEDYDTSDFRAFLRGLNTNTAEARVDARMNTRRVPDPNCAGLSTDLKEPTRPKPCSVTAPSSAVILGARHPSGDHPKVQNGLSQTTKLCRSISSQPMDTRHYFPQRQSLSGSSNSSSFQSLNPIRCNTLDQPELRVGNRANATPNEVHGQDELSGRILPSTERCEEEIRITMTNSACNRLTVGRHSGSQSEVSTGSGMRPFKCSARSRSNAPTNRVATPAGLNKNTAKGFRDLEQSSDTTCWTRSTNGNSRWNDNPDKSIDNNAHAAKESVSRTLGSMSSNADVQSSKNTNTATSQPSGLTREKTIDGPQKPVKLELISNPRVLLEYGDL